MNTRDIQTVLKAKGFDPGPIDGIWGRRTMAAVRAFQAANPPLEVDGIVGPKTLAKLAPTGAMPATPPWLAIAKSKLGLIETRDNAALKAFLKSDGATLGDPAKLPWCGDFVETCIALALPAEVLPTNPYYALNWLRFGRQDAATTDAPSLGAVCVFKREGGGHVGFAVGHDGAYVHVLGGNQSNSVSVSRVSKSRLQGYRWPLSYERPSKGLPITTLGQTIAVSYNEA